MWDQWRSWRTSMPLSDPIERQQAPLLRSALVVLLGMFLLLMPLVISQPTAAGQLVGAIISVVTVGALVGALVALHRGAFQAAVNIAAGTMLLLLSNRLLAVGLERNAAVLAAYAIPITLAGLLGRRTTLLSVAAVAVALVSGGAGLALLSDEAAALSAHSRADILRVLATFVSVVIFLVVLLDRVGGSLRTALLLTLAREQELEQLRAGLEQMVADRTAALSQALAEAQEARAAADQANQLKTRFLANMSHELRTPLNAILNFTDMIGLPRFGPLTERQSELQQRVLSSAEHLLGLINDVLDVAKIEAGRMDLLYEVVDLSALLQSMMSTASGLTKDKGLQLVLDVPASLPPVRIDKTRIRQVLLNLLSNAAKFTDRGNITLQAHVRPDGLVELAVLDTGIGIDPAHHALIFEEFRQVQDSNTRSYGGTGLGLPISRRLVEMHGGQMWMESTPGLGSTFAFTLPTVLPLDVPPAVAAGEQALERFDLSHSDRRDDDLRPMVVVVDDDLDAHAILTQQLIGTGYAVHSILDSRQALATIASLQPQLVVLDVQMAHLDGWAVLTQLRSTEATAMIPVMMCTIVDEQRQGALLGASDYVLKPVRQDDFLSRVRRWLDGPAHVLVVDDDANARRIAREVLESQGYSVLEATNGAEALARLSESRPALMILDLMMPVMDGFEVLQWLDAHPEYQSLPVIVISARDLNPDEASWVRIRSCEYVQKGRISTERLLSHIHRCLRRDRPQPAADRP